MNSSRIRFLAFAFMLITPLFPNPTHAAPGSALIAKAQNIPVAGHAEIIHVGTTSEQTSADTLQLLLEGNDWMLDLEDEDGDGYRPVLIFFQRSDGSVAFSIRFDRYGRELLNPRVTINGSKVKLKLSLSQDCGPRDYSIRLRLKGDGTFSAKGKRERSHCRGGTRPVSGTMH